MSGVVMESLSPWVFLSRRPDKIIPQYDVGIAFLSERRVPFHLKLVKTYLFGSTEPGT